MSATTERRAARRPAETRPSGQRAATKRRPFPVRYIILGVVAIPWIVLPLWLIVVNSFKTGGEASIPSLSWPKIWNAGANYRAVLVQGDFLTGLANSAMIAIPTILVTLLLASMAAWSYARSSSRSMKIAYYGSSLAIILPPAVIPTVFILTEMGINGSRIGYFLTLVGVNSGVIVFLCTGYLRTLPLDLEEAAELDGAGKWAIYRHVVLPLLSPALFTGAVMLVIAIWNEFFFALFLLRDQSESTLPLLLYQFASSSTEGVAWNLVFADVILTGLPLMIAYVVLQKRVIAGLTEGSTTG